MFLKKDGGLKKCLLSQVPVTFDTFLEIRQSKSFTKNHRYISLQRFFNHDLIARDFAAGFYLILKKERNGV